jgi:flavin reductase (DIM6/NTAB) family NADH-FMN oxidoreductase RutF
MARKSFKAGALTAPLPPVMVTVGDMENSNIITIGWTGILSSDPPRTYISVRPSRHSHKMLLEKKEFVINLTSEELALATDYVGIYTGAKVNKFEKCKLTKTESKEVAAPTIMEAPVSLECKVFDVIELGTHHMFLADIVSVGVDEKCIDEAGKLRLDKCALAAYAHGDYFELGKKIGSFGFSVKKKHKHKNGGKKK